MYDLPLNDSKTPVSVDKVQSILLVEDDVMVSSLIKSFLNHSGYNVDQVYHGDEVIDAIKETKPALIVLDLGLPGLDGFEVCKEARKVFNGPIVILTGRADEEQQILAFDLGADDFIIKPVSHNILRVRIESLLRRQVEHNPIEVKVHFHVGDIDIYPQANRCLVNNKVIQLSTFEFKLMSLLMKNEGRVMSRDSIYNLLLGRDYNGVERTVDVRISKLREKLTSQGMVKTKIETVWGTGYILNENQIS